MTVFIRPSLCLAQIAEDSTLNAIVVMFRSTYGNEAGWCVILILLATRSTRWHSKALSLVPCFGPLPP